MNELRAVGVPTVVVEPLRETVVLLFQATAEALSSAAQAVREGDSLAEAQQHRSRLGELAVLLDQLGWSTRDVPSSDLTIKTRVEVLSDAVYGALIDAAERLAVACSTAWRREATPDDIAIGTAEVALLTLLLRRADATTTAPDSR